jgi:glycosyltransferase involved in cell wall biosynthesis
MTGDAFSVVHFSTADIIGGSAKAAFRIHRGLAALGHRSRMLVRHKQSDDATVETIWPNGPARLWDRAWEAFSTRSGLQYLYVPSTKRALRHRWLRQADIVQLYNTHGGYLSLSALPQLSRRAPVVWRLSDMWPATGHCAYAGECERWKEGCGRCPDLAAYPPVRRDFTANLWRRKRVAYATSDITLVAPSSWMERIVRVRPLLRDLPCERAAARAELAISETSTVILFAAHILDGNPRKGGERLIAALRSLGPMPDCVLLLAGVGGESWAGAQPLETRLAGYREAPEEMAKVYAAADIAAIPSLDENLANTALEALASGLPVIAFDAGGTRDAVIHMETGYLARPGDIDDLAEGIRRFVQSAELRRRIGRAADALTAREFAMTRQTERFAALYRDLLARRRANPATANSLV